MGREEWNYPKLTQSFSKLAIFFFLPTPFLNLMEGTFLPLYFQFLEYAMYLMNI